MAFWSQNHITFIFIKKMSHDLLVQMAYREEKSLRHDNNNNNIFYLNTVGFKANIAYEAV